MFKLRANRDRQGRTAADSAQFSPGSERERRWRPRAAASFAARFRERWRARFDVGIVELSTHGCRVECATPPTPGAGCWVMLPAIESLYARVVWRRDSHFGLEFEQPLHPAVIAMLLCGAPMLQSKR